jgi:5-hydroxyisourate hydrolase-like protein (transthyretin family)
LFGTIFDILIFIFYGLAWILEFLRMLVTIKSKGTVTDSETNNPLEQAIVRLIEIKNNKEDVLEIKVTDKKGRYDFLVLPGEYKLSVNRSGYQTYNSKKFEVKSHRFLDFDIKLRIHKPS